MSFGYPILLNLSGRRAVIVGGGGVALRKANGLYDAGCRDVVVVAPAFVDGFPPGVRRLTEQYRPDHLNGAFVAFAATDSSDVNDAVVRDAEARNILVTRADGDEAHPGTFANAAVHRDGALMIAVSTGGSPALAARVRDDIAAALDRSYAAMAGTLQSLRPKILATPGVEISQRRAIFRELASNEATGILATTGPEGLWRWLVSRHPNLDPEP